MVNEQVNDGQQAVSDDSEDPAMDSSWARVARLLRQRKHTQVWLASQLGYTKQRVGMWASRGAIPAEEHAAVAAVLGKSVDWVAGVVDVETPERDLSAMARTIGREFDTIKDPDQALKAFAQIIAAIERARST